MNNELKVASGMLCLMSRTDYDRLSDEKKAEIKPFYDAFQDSVREARLVSVEEATTIEILLNNNYVKESDQLLWSGIHDLISPGSTAYVEFHNFDDDGNTINIEKYIIDSVAMSVVKEAAIRTDMGLIGRPQTIKITGCVASEITITDKSK